MPKFSIITPVRIGNGPSDRPDRAERFLACIESVKHQTFKDFEWIVLDDGSPESFDWSKVFSPENDVNLVKLPHGERIIAYNTGLKVAKGEWIFFLDSDDEYKPNYLERVNYWIGRYPKEKMFNFGAIYAHRDGSFTFRDPFIVKRKKRGHVVFGGGNIVNGTFIFNRSIYDTIGGYPGDETGWVKNIDCTPINYGGVRDLYMGTPYDFSAAAQMEMPELRQFYMVNHIAEPHKIVQELGNPWGNDMYLFFKYTRKYHSRAIKEHYLIVHTKSEVQ